MSDVNEKIGTEDGSDFEGHKLGGSKLSPKLSPKLDEDFEGHGMDVGSKLSPKLDGKLEG